MNERKIACIHCHTSSWSIVMDKLGKHTLYCGGCKSSVPALVAISSLFRGQIEYVERISGPQQ